METAILKPGIRNTLEPGPHSTFKKNISWEKLKVRFDCGKEQLEEPTPAEEKRSAGGAKNPCPREFTSGTQGR